MPKTSINYDNSIIYTISKRDLVYVGSTTDFIRRHYQHKCGTNNIKHREYNHKLYKIIRENGGWNEFEMKIYKIFPCKDKKELLIEEEKIRKTLNAQMNKCHCYSTEEDKCERQSEYQKQYRKENGDHLNEYLKQYRLNKKS